MEIERSNYGDGLEHAIAWTRLHSFMGLIESAARSLSPRLWVMPLRTCASDCYQCLIEEIVTDVCPNLDARLARRSQVKHDSGPV
jgi:hypothetical protein